MLVVSIADVKCLMFMPYISDLALPAIHRFPHLPVSGFSVNSVVLQLFLLLSILARKASKNKTEDQQNAKKSVNRCAILCYAAEKTRSPVSLPVTFGIQVVDAKLEVVQVLTRNGVGSAKKNSVKGQSCVELGKNKHMENNKTCVSTCFNLTFLLLDLWLAS